MYKKEARFSLSTPALGHQHFLFGTFGIFWLVFTVANGGKGYPFTCSCVLHLMAFTDGGMD
jgi:hypothetical protein